MTEVSCVDLQKSSFEDSKKIYLKCQKKMTHLLDVRWEMTNYRTTEGLFLVVYFILFFLFFFCLFVLCNTRVPVFVIFYTSVKFLSDERSFVHELYCIEHFTLFYGSGAN